MKTSVVFFIAESVELGELFIFLIYGQFDEIVVWIFVMNQRTIVGPDYYSFLKIAPIGLGEFIRIFVRIN